MRRADVRSTGGPAPCLNRSMLWDILSCLGLLVGCERLRFTTLSPRPRTHIVKCRTLVARDACDVSSWSSSAACNTTEIGVAWNVRACAIPSSVRFTVEAWGRVLCEC